MSTLELPFVARPVAPSFKWRQSGGSYIGVKEMATRHIFFTIILIWNHSCPEKGRCHRFGRRYGYFAPEYTPRYMLDAFRALTAEYNTRNDRLHAWDAALADMVAFWFSHREEMLWLE